MFLLFTLPPLLAADPSEFPEQPNEVIVIPPGEAFLRFTSPTGRTLVMQTSIDLRNWDWIPGWIEAGNGQETTHNIGSTADRLFVRLWHTDLVKPPDVSYEMWDADGDGLGNEIELLLGTNPLKFSTGNSGIADGWLVAHGFDPLTDPSSLLFQGGPHTVLEAWQMGVSADPDATTDDHDGDGIPNSVDSSPLEKDTLFFEIETTTLSVSREQGGMEFRETTTKTERFSLDRIFVREPHMFGGVATVHHVPQGGTLETSSVKIKAAEAINKSRQFTFLHLLSLHSAPITSPNPTYTLRPPVQFVIPANGTESQTEMIDPDVTDLTPSTPTLSQSAYLVPVEILIPKIDSEGDQIDGEFLNARELKVAKWEHAFEGTFNNGQVKADFIDWDKDRFYLHVPLGMNLGVTAAEIATGDNPDPAYDDDPTEIDLGGDDHAISGSMILVADDHDDDFAGSGAGVDDAKNDRTHKIQLGGNLIVKRIKVQGAWHELNLKIPVPAKRQIDVDFYRMNIPDVHTLEEINKSVKIMKEHYAQIGLKINVTVGGMAWPQLTPDRGEGILRLFDGNVHVNGYLVGPMSDEYKQFINATDSNGINIFFLKFAYSSRGVALTPYQLRHEEGEVDGKYFNKAFINFAAGPISGGTPAHELLHILAYKDDEDDHDDHNEPYFNLLNDRNVNIDPVLWSKRINKDQRDRSYQHPAVKEIP